jgi:acetolactate synthase-1/2/3 large subunit
MSTAAETLAKQLAQAGVQRAFGVTGSGASLALIQALARQNIPYHAAQHEASAALMAGACGFDGQLRAASITIKGPGFANAAPALLANLYEQRAMVSISEAYGPETPIWRRHKRLDHAALCETVAKAYCPTVATDKIADILALSSANPPGPVHLDLWAGSEMPAQIHVATQHPKSNGAFEDLLQRIQAASRPAIALGAGIRQHPALLKMLQDLRIPVVTTAAAKGCFDETLPHSAGIITGETGTYAPETTILPQADLVIGLCLSNEEVVAPGAFPAPLVMLDNGWAEPRNGFGAEIAVGRTNLDDIVVPLADALTAKDWGADLITKTRADRDDFLKQAGWQPALALGVLHKTLPDQTVLIPDTGFHCTMAETLWPARCGSGFLGSSRARYMGIAIPTAIGRALSDPDSPVLCVFGDGGFTPHAFEIALAVQHNLPILFAYFSDGGYGSVAGGASDPEIDGATRFDTNRRWNMVKTLGCTAHRVTDADALTAAVADWTPDQGPRFVQCNFDPAGYARQAKEMR